MGLAILLRPARIHILLPTLGIIPVLGYIPLPDLFILLPAVALYRRLHQGRIDDLSASGNEPLAGQLLGHLAKQRLRSCLTYPVLEMPDRGPVRYPQRIVQTTEALVAHPVEQLILHLLVRQVIQSLQNQYPHHCLRRVRRPASFRSVWPRYAFVHPGGQRCEIDMALDLLQRISQLIQLLMVCLMRKQICLYRCALPVLHHLPPRAFMPTSLA